SDRDFGGRRREHLAFLDVPLPPRDSRADPGIGGSEAGHAAGDAPREAAAPLPPSAGREGPHKGTRQSLRGAGGGESGAQGATGRGAAEVHSSARGSSEEAPRRKTRKIAAPQLTGVL